jgi:filamentous hemagglutinin
VAKLVDPSHIIRVPTLEHGNDQILSRELQVAIPAATTPTQWEQINRAIQYGASQGIKVTITMVR